MPKFTLSRLCPLICSTALAVLITMAASTAAAAEGSAVFASVTTTDQEFATKAQIGVDFGVDVRATRVWVEEAQWIRLQSSIMPEADARALVSSARDKGYDAWYDSSGNQWADTREKSGGRLARTTTYTSSKTTYAASDLTTTATAEGTSAQSDLVQSSDASNWGVVTPATGDVSHLPLAETFPIE